MAFRAFDFSNLLAALLKDLPGEVVGAIDAVGVQDAGSLLCHLDFYDGESPCLLVGRNDEWPSHEWLFRPKQTKDMLKEFRKACEFLRKIEADGWSPEIIELTQTELLLTWGKALNETAMPKPNLTLGVYERGDGDEFSYVVERCAENDRLRQVLESRKTDVFPQAKKRRKPSSLEELGEAPLEGLYEFLRSFFYTDVRPKLAASEASADTIFDLNLWLPGIYYLPKEGIGPRLQIFTEEGVDRGVCIFEEATACLAGESSGLKSVVDRYALLKGKSAREAETSLRNLVGGQGDYRSAKAVLGKAVHLRRRQDRYDEEIRFACTTGQPTVRCSSAILRQGMSAAGTYNAYVDDYVRITARSSDSSVLNQALFRALLEEFPRRLRADGVFDGLQLGPDAIFEVNYGSGGACYRLSDWQSVPRKCRSARYSDVVTTRYEPREQKLVEACKAGDVKVLKQTIERCHRAFRDDDERSLLHLAAAAAGAVPQPDRLAVVALLIEYGVDLEAKDEAGETPLSLAVGSGAVELVRLLLESGARATNDGRPGIERTLLHRAIKGGHTDIVRILAAAGADLLAQDSGGITPLQEAIKSGDTGAVLTLLDLGVSLTDPQGMHRLTPLQSAAIEGKTEIFAALLAQGADPLATGEGRDSALAYVYAGRKDALFQSLVAKLPPAPASLGVLAFEGEQRDAILEAAGIPGGVPIRGVICGSAADRMKLDPNDILMALDWTPLHQFSDLVAALASRKAGDTVEVTVRRDGTTVSATAMIGPRYGGIIRTTAAERDVERDTERDGDS